MTTIKKWWVARKERRIVDRYVQLGMEWGEAESYRGFLGKCIGYDRLLRNLKKMEVKYVALGYEPISMAEWLENGLFRDDIKPKLRVPAKKKNTQHVNQ